MEVESKKGAGSIFRVYIPAVAEIAEDRPTPAPVETPHGLGEVILVIEDEASIRSILRQVLQTFGYVVLEASNGQDGLKLYQERWRDVTLVLSDMMMPVLDGPRLVNALRLVNEQVRVVAISGMPLEQIFDGSDVSASSLQGYLPKPFTADQLLNSIRNAINQNL